MWCELAQNDLRSDLQVSSTYPKLRLAIYENLRQCSDRYHSWRRNHLTVASTGNGDVKVIASLSRTCKQVHSEVAELLYDRTFDIQVTNMPAEAPCSTQQPHEGYSFVKFIPRAAMSLALYRYHGAFSAPLLTAEKVLEMLATGSQLPHLSFHFGTGAFDAKKNLGVETDVARLRRAANREGRNGKEHRDRELVYAEGVVGLLQDIVLRQYNGNEERLLEALVADK
ncbi:hypothetical protein LTR37_014022 [Vermiconidia calcicola]|uniref:Uncharacterized protein n=1 Tax=Vermiconidia calcicola TaxID=1690605 RepID=A0ACC3MUU8_9PEZI|nr:hypothetical protein LTR37_014022 [Vermiconidia calcicola]